MSFDFETGLAYAKSQDAQDALAYLQKEYYRPMMDDKTPYIYLCGNSLGLQHISVRAAIEQELKDWQMMGVEGHFYAQNPWMPYHEFLSNAMAEIVGANPTEVVVMNTLTVNLHLMMVSFYKPTKDRFKILIESDAFPSDRYAVESQLKLHGYSPEEALLELKPRESEVLIRAEDIEELINRQGDEIALIMLGNTNYYTGQYFDMKRIATLGHAKGCMVGFDCAHGAGNVELNLHDSGVDFAVWCSYKYLNSGPGSVAGCFVHERHASRQDLLRFAGWWGHDKATRFNMRHDFMPIDGAEGWQLSNPPILSMAAVKASIEVFQKVGMQTLRKKAIRLTSYLEYLLNLLDDPSIQIITPKDPNKRGSQLSIQLVHANKELFDKISDDGVIADWREPDVIRIAPTAMYNSYQDVYHFVQILKHNLQTS